MRESFKIFYEKRIRNPLRKKEVGETHYNYKEWVEEKSLELPPEEQAKIDRMIEAGVPEEKIEYFRNGKIQENKRRLEREYLRTKIEGPILLFDVFGIKVFQDRYCQQDFSEKTQRGKILKMTVKRLVIYNKDILPIRKFKLVITDTEHNPVSSGVNILGGKSSPTGLYINRLIFIDQNHYNDFNVLLHEYAHFISFNSKSDIRKLLDFEYKKLLDEYFEKSTKRKKLHGVKNKKHREGMAKKLGLPSDYAASDYDEWFAELITHWKNLPNDPVGYRFKKILKNVLQRI